MPRAARPAVAQPPHPAQISPTHALNPTASGGSAPRTPAPLLWCRAALAGRKAARAVLPALGGRAHPCARLGLAPVCVAALCWSPCGCGRAVGRVAPGLGGSSGLVCGVYCGRFLLSRFVPRCRRAARASSALGALVALAGRVGAVGWRVSLAAAGLGAVVFGGGGRGGFRVAGAGLGLRVGLVGLGRLPAGGSAVSRCGGSGVRRLRAGGCAAVSPAGRSRRVARRVGLGAGRLGRWGFRLWRGGAAAALPFGRQRRGLPLARWVLVTAPALPLAIQTVVVSAG